MLRATESLLTLLVCLMITGCGHTRSLAAPPVSQCLDQPSAHVPDEPAAPADGEAIPDTYVVALKAWGNSLLGVITQDRIAWRGERRCVRRLVDAEIVR